MTTDQTNSVLNTVKEAFAPVTDAFKNLQNMEVPEAAREFVKKTPTPPRSAPPTFMPVRRR